MIVLSIDNRAHLSLSHLPAGVVGQIQDRLTFLNPAHQEAERRGFSTWNIDREIRGYQRAGDELTVPRGFSRQLVVILHRAGVQYRIEDRRRVLSEVDFTFLGDLHGFQVEAVNAMAARDFGTLSAPTGSGKTMMALPPRKDKSRVVDSHDPVRVLENAARTRQRVYGKQGE